MGMSLKKLMAMAGVGEVPVVGQAVSDAEVERRPVVVEAGRMLPRQVVDKMATETVPVEKAVDCGWPVEADAVVDGPCLNPRFISVKVDGRVCSMWNERKNLRRGQVVRVTLDRPSEGNPIYRQVIAPS